jgi:putative nucleotidyltransferase with HDIG domain
VHHGPVIITAGVIIGVTLIFTILSIVLGRRPKKDDEYTLMSRPASWEREGGEDLTSPMIGARHAEPAPAGPVTPIAFSRPAPTAVAPAPAPVHASAPAPVAAEPMRVAAPVLSQPPPPPPGPLTLPEGSRARPADAAEPGPGLMDEVVKGLEQIPPLPKAVDAILRELNATGSSARSVGEIVSSDPVIGAAVLRVVNSAATGVRRHILTVNEAVAYLGFANVRTMILRFNVSQLFKSPAPGQALCYDSDALWKHSMAVSQVADALAKRTKRVDPDLASTLGLLHDIGKLAINSQFPKKVALLWRPAGLIGAPEESWLARERRLFGADHAFIGAFLAARWMLPEELADAIRLHHLPPEVALDSVVEPVRLAVQVVHVANQLVKYRHVYCADMEIDPLDPALLSELGLPAEIDQIFDEQLDRVIASACALANGITAAATAGTPPMRASA